MAPLSSTFSLEKEKPDIQISADIPPQPPAARAPRAAHASQPDPTAPEAPGDDPRALHFRSQTQRFSAFHNRPAAGLRSGSRRFSTQVKVEAALALAVVPLEGLLNQVCAPLGRQAPWAHPGTSGARFQLHHNSASFKDPSEGASINTSAILQRALPLLIPLPTPRWT